MKPLEIKDFSGGETDNFFQGEPTRAERLWNLLIGIDHKLSSRQGSLVKNNAAKAERINSVQSFNSFTELLYSSEGHFYDIDGTEILGDPSGNIAFVGATPEAVYTSADLQAHLILACDEKLQPQKIYRDQAGDLQVRTVGLPQVTRPIISDADLLAECITAANLLRTRFLNHINSAENLNSERDGTSFQYPDTTEQPVTSTNAHWSVDKYAKCYIDTGVTFSVGQWQPSTIPTPALAATDYDSLVLLIEALNLAFEEHRQDSAGFAQINNEKSSTLIVGPNRYHAIGYQTQFTDLLTGNFGWPHTGGMLDNLAKPFSQGIQQRVTENPDPETAINPSVPENEIYRTKLEAIATFLDDFAVKFCLHETAPFVHRYNSQNAQGNTLVDAAFAHQFLEPLLGDAPIVAPTPFNFIYSANYVQRAMENHFLNSDVASALSATLPTMHAERNSPITSGLQKAGYYFATLPPTPTIREQFSAFKWDVILAKISIFTARYSYFIHTLDLLYGSQVIQTSSTASSTGTLIQFSPATGILPKHVVQSTAAFAGRASTKTPRQQHINGLISTAASPANSFNTCFNVPVGGQTPLSVGTLVMHPYALMSGNSSFANYDQEAQYLSAFGYAPDIYTMSGWIDLMKTFYDVFKEHVSAVNTHFNVETAHFEFQPSSVSTGLPAGGVQYFPLSNLLPTVDLPGVVPLFMLNELSAKSYGYAFTYSDTYTLSDDITYKVESQPVFVGPVSSEATLGVGVTKVMYGETDVFQTNQIITPVAMIFDALELTNTSETNYADTLLNYYRTTGNGTTYFKINTLEATPLTSLVWPTITLLGQYDLVSDNYAVAGNPALADLTSPELYTNGGVSPSAQPPKSKYVWLANGYVYYAGVYDGDTFKPNRVLQSSQLAPDWVPPTNYVDFESPVIGGGSARNVNVCLTETGVYRLEGAFGIDGSGSIVKQQISNQIGGISATSIVVTELGIFFGGTNGFYYTDGYQCIRISQEKYRTFAVATETSSQKRAMKGVYDRTNRRIFWSVRSTSSEADNDLIMSYDLNFGITPSGAFTTLFGGEGSWNPSALGFFGNTLYIGDTDGYLYYWDEDTKTDPLKDLLSAPNTWETTHIPWEYRSPMMDFGGTAMRKFFSRIHHVGKNRGDVALQYYITADNRVTQDLAPMRFIDPGNTGVVDQWRRVGGKKLRADLYQIGVKNGRFTVYNSDTYEGTPVFVSHVGNDTTVDMLNTHIPTDAVGMSICFASDYYETEFEIKSVSIAGLDTTLVLDDPANEANNLLALGWEIRGFMKEQAFSLDALTIWFEEQGNLGSQYRGYSSTEGGGGNRE